MRADRLVAILLMLQTRGQVTAAEVATELEISERTARRDLDSLGVAGLPVYSMQGRNGGWRLLGEGGVIQCIGTTSQQHMIEDLAIFEFELTAAEEAGLAPLFR